MTVEFSRLDLMRFLRRDFGPRLCLFFTCVNIRQCQHYDASNKPEFNLPQFNTVLGGGIKPLSAFYTAVCCLLMRCIAT